jgi:hypothetical protein
MDGHHLADVQICDGSILTQWSARSSNPNEEQMTMSVFLIANAECHTRSLGRGAR